MAGFLERDAQPFEQRCDRQDRVRQRNNDVADHDRVEPEADVRPHRDRQEPVERREQYEQRDPEHEVRDHEGREHERRERGLPPERPPDERIGREDAEHHRDQARRDRDEGASLERLQQRRVRRGLRVPRRREPLERERDVPIVEREDEQHEQRQIEERHQQHEEDPERAVRSARSGEVAHVRTRLNRPNSAIKIPTTNKRKNARTEPLCQSSARVNWSCTALPNRKPRVPPTSCGVTNSPIVGTNTKMNAAATPGADSGRVTRRNVRNRLAPRSPAASSSDMSIPSSPTKIGRATNGIHTYASTSITANWL